MSSIICNNLADGNNHLLYFHSVVWVCLCPGIQWWELNQEGSNICIVNRSNTCITIIKELSGNERSD